MSDDAHTNLQMRMSHLAERAIARIHENRPDLRTRSPEETIATINEEQRRTRTQPTNESFVTADMAED